jgi:uncharacterized protein with PQ loop repeat
VFVLGVWGLRGFVAATGFSDFQEGIHMIGTLGMIASILYYASPLASLFTVLQKRDSSSIYLPLVCVNFINASMWTGYGAFAKGDINIALPNGLGMILAIIQAFIRLTIPAKEIQQAQSFEYFRLLFQGKIPPALHESVKAKMTTNKQETRKILSSSDPLDDDDPQI